MSQMVRVPRRKHFDLRAGDKISAMDEVLGRQTTYKITDISTHTFACESKPGGYKTSFRIIDYKLGLGIQKIKN